MKQNLIRVLSLCLLAAILLAGCGGNGAASTEAPAGETAVDTVPAETMREVTVVGDKMRHLTYNIAGSDTLERIPNFDLNETKRANIKKYIEELDPDTFGIQEAPQAWIEGMVGLLDNKYAMVGGSHEQIVNNEKFWFNPIYYKVDTFNLLDSGVLFLNEGFGYEKSNRNAAFALLERISDGELVLILSLHLEHRGLGTEDLKTYNYTNYLYQGDDRNCLRDEQVEYLCKAINTKLTEYAGQYDKEISVLVSGDFNINQWQDEDYTNEYTRLCQSFAAMEMSPGMQDTSVVCANLVTNQTRAKWQTYRETFTSDAPYARLDYIFGSNNLVIDSFTVFNTPAGTGDSSDHHPVYIDYYIGH